MSFCLRLAWNSHPSTYPKPLSPISLCHQALTPPKIPNIRVPSQAKYEERKKKARAEGKRTPKYPKPSAHMDSKIDPADSGM